MPELTSGAGEDFLLCWKKKKEQEEIKTDFRLGDILWITCLINELYLAYFVPVLLSVFQKSIYISIQLMTCF